ncbi:hypothetical protein Q4I28_000460 [Leishmania naiffi]|uniref:Uncharacterized protein n=1 Tax=Leishmania naiffi TaxID=5678 RepID=A0AAW3CC21_9TRYP
MDNRCFAAPVSQDGLALVEGRARLTLERGCLDMVKWIRDAGVHCVSCVKRSVRLLVLERAGVAARPQLSDAPPLPGAREGA